MRNACRINRLDDCSGCARWKATPGATGKTPSECQKLDVFHTDQSLMNISHSSPTVQSLVIPAYPHTRIPAYPHTRVPIHPRFMLTVSKVTAARKRMFVAVAFSYLIKMSYISFVTLKKSWVTPVWLMICSTSGKDHLLMVKEVSLADIF